MAPARAAVSLVTALLIVIASVVGMEVAAILIHKHIMHGAGWGWHESHHTETDGPFEVNDLYAVVFSTIAAVLFIIGLSIWSPATWIGVGLTIYGLLYTFVHDGLVHQRFPFKVKPRGAYMKRLVQAHRMHHAVHTRDGTVSFGFLWAPDTRKLKAELKTLQGRA